MEDPTTETGRIRILPVSVSQKIAAGEVIERPQALVRELVDNALDAEATMIDLFLEEGGNQLVAVQDNGNGMCRSDLLICCVPHSTSKISRLEDLFRINTLGFRGEALASMAAVSRMTIQTHDGKEGGMLRIDGGAPEHMVPWSGARGTRIEVNNLFFNVPARKQFLKRSGTEGLLCRQTFLEKALAHPGCGFRLHKENNLDIFLPPGSPDDLRKRFLDIHRDIPANTLLEASHQGQDFSFHVLFCRPEWYRTDRKGIQVFVNQRKIQEYGLMQAVEHSFEGLMPGGRFPVAAVFLKVAPHLLDVNIHPAKREVKIMNFADIHRSLVHHLSSALRMTIHRPAAADSREPAIQHQLSGWADAPGSLTPASRDREVREVPSGTPAFPSSTSWKDHPPAQPVLQEESPSFRMPGNNVPLTESARSASPPEGVGFRFLGQVFGVFLLFVQEDNLYLMDMHAAHERILYDRFCRETRTQNLLVPREIPLDREDTMAPPWLLSALEELGFRTSGEPGRIMVHGLPSVPSCRPETILSSLGTALAHPESLARAFHADLACKAAIKDGEILDQETARMLISEALALPEKRCPHGRPVFLSFSRSWLWDAIGRSV